MNDDATPRPGFQEPMALCSLYLSPRQVGTLGQVFQTLAEPQPENEVRSKLGHLLLSLLDADYYASYVWSASQHRYAHCVALNMSESNLDAYETYHQFHDPITPLLQMRRGPTRVVDVMPQDELVQTPFFCDFLARDGLYWGVNLQAWDGPVILGDLRIWRTQHKHNFDQGTLELLRLIQPALTSALRRTRPPSSQSMHPEPEAWTSLSPRERQIANLIVKGLPDKAIARTLGISSPTVRTHIGHVFQKLGVSNRVQLAGQSPPPAMRPIIPPASPGSA